MKFKNPANGYVEEANHPGLWCFLFGPFYFMIRGVWAHVIISAVVACITFGIGWLIYPFFAKGILKKNYLRRGWQEVSEAEPITQ